MQMSCLHPSKGFDIYKPRHAIFEINTGDHIFRYFFLVTTRKYMNLDFWQSAV